MKKEIKIKLTKEQWIELKRKKGIFSFTEYYLYLADMK